MKKAIPTEQTPDNIQQVLTLLADAPHRLSILAAPLSLEQLTQPLAPGERSFTETLVHLVNTETLTAESIFLALLRKEPLLHKLHAERDLGKLLRLDRYPFHDLLAYFIFRRQVLLDVLRPLSEKQWARTVREEGKARRESVYWRARGQALHELEHILDLETKID
jgi:hypothetical protein